jgi:hypothetical protein
MMYFAVNYGNMLRWQIRAQNNADAAASMFASLQTESWNQMTAVIYASDIEEFRIRKQFDDLFNIMHSAGGCREDDNFVDDTLCAKAWTSMQSYFQAAVTRYGNDAAVLQSIVENASFDRIYSQSNPTSDMNLLLKQLNNTGSCLAQQTPATWIPSNGDCAFYYQVLAVQQRTGLMSASEDAWNRAVPNPAAGSNGYNKQLTPECTTTCGTAGITSDFQNAGLASPYFNNQLWAPVQVEVSACSQVQPIIANFFGLKASSFYAIGRAAATAVIVDQDWLQPGSFTPLYKATGVSLFQGNEPYEQEWNGSGYTGPEQWYDLTYGGIAWYDNTTYYQWSNFPGNDFEAETAWWAPIPIAPFSQISGANAENLIKTSGTTTCQKNRAAAT